MGLSPYLSVIIPAYNQAQTICDDILTLQNFLEKFTFSYEIIVVVDGNQDHTFEKIAQNNQLPELRVECFIENHGKGSAVRHGFSIARGEYIAFMDAGGDLHPQDLERMIAEIRLKQADIVIGSKRHASSHVSYPPIRRLYSYLYQLVNRILFRLHVRDTQVGMKLFRRDVVQTILPRLLVKRFAFDLELLVLAQHCGFKNIVETPITIKHTFSSNVNWRATYQTLWDTLAIFYRSRILKTYDRPFTPKNPPLSPILLQQRLNTYSEKVSTTPQPEKSRQYN